MLMVSSVSLSDQEITGCLRTYQQKEYAISAASIPFCLSCVYYVAVFLAKASIHIHASTDMHTLMIGWLGHVQMPCGFGTLSRLLVEILVVLQYVCTQRVTSPLRP